jgi:predicted GIY-YIG superfamily endonuclease
LNSDYIGEIYKITNKINGKIYIGQTQVGIEKRWCKHIESSKYKDFKIS